MAKIIWRDRMSVGVPIIDSDHKTLVGFLNNLDSAIHAQIYDQRAVALTLLRLIEYTKEHFAREEKLMTKAQYPLIDQHVAEHRKGVAAIGDLSLTFAKSPTKDTAEQIYTFTTDWLINHIILSDAKMAPYTKGIWL